MIKIKVGVRTLDQDQKQTLNSAKTIAGLWRAVLQSTIAMVGIVYSEAAPFLDQHQPGMGLQAGGARAIM